MNRIALLLKFSSSSTQKQNLTMVKILISHFKQEMINFKIGDSKQCCRGPAKTVFWRVFCILLPQYYHISGFELLQEDLNALLAENFKDSRALSYKKKVYPTKRQNQSIPGRDILIFVYIVAIITISTWRLGRNDHHLQIY